MPESFDKLRGPDGLSSLEILWVWLGVRIEREKVETSLFAFERGQAWPLGLVSVISPWLCSARGGLEPFAGRPSNLGLWSLISNEATAVSWCDTNRWDAMFCICNVLNAKFNRNRGGVGNVTLVV